MRSNPLSIDILHDTGCNYLLPACSPTFQIDAAGNQELLQYYGISAQGNIFYTLVYKQNGIEKYFQKVLANSLKTCTFAAVFTKTHKM